MPITHNIRDLERGLSNTARRQIPFAVSLAINRTLGDVKENTDKRMARRLDRPTPFTMRAFRVRRSSKRKLRGQVYAQDIQAEYLQYAEDGGTREPEGRAIVVPVRQRLNKYGNMPRRAIARALARPDTFSGGRTDGLAPGIYKRTARGLHMLAAYVDRARYSERLDFIGGARKTAAARFERHVARAMREAIRTARR